MGGESHWSGFISQYVTGCVARQNVITCGTVNCLYRFQRLKVMDYSDAYGYTLDVSLVSCKSITLCEFHSFYFKWNGYMCIRVWATCWLL